MRVSLGMLVAVLAALVASVPAGAQTSGNESFSGVIVASSTLGEREVLASSIVAKGVFTGAGKIVEIPSLPGDPDGVVRDDLVFADGTMHLVSTAVDFSVSLNPISCLLTVSVAQTGVITGGTGAFAAASGTFTGSVDGQGVLPRNPDRSCALDQSPRHEVDKVSAVGTLSF